MRSIAPEDMIRFGMIPEFIGRLPVVTVLDQLKVADLEKILLRTKNAMVKQYSKLFAMDGVRLRFTSDAVKAVAVKAIELKTGRPGPEGDPRGHHARDHVRPSPARRRGRGRSSTRRPWPGGAGPTIKRVPRRPPNENAA